MKNSLFFRFVCLFSISFLALEFNSFAQVLEAPPLNGVYERKNTPTRKPIPYCNLREADVMWTKRVWRMIDLRQKINHPLYYPTQPIGGYKSLIKNLIDGVIEEGSITLYYADVMGMTNDNEYDTRLTSEEAQNIFGTEYDTIEVDNIETGLLERSITEKVFDPGTVKRFLVKEDWFFDKQRSVMDVRIIGLCPFTERETGGEISYIPLAWVYFPQARNIFASRDVFNRHNTAERRTFDDIFMKRMFDSYIMAAENVYNDRQINSYIKSGTLDELLESEKIKNDIFIVEHDLWEH